MGLFHAVSRRNSRALNGPRPFVPAFMKRLNLSCRSGIHPWLRTNMSFIAHSTSDNGQPMVVYACPVCSWREGWVQDYLTGSPRKLWGGHHDGR